jgi:hypothetical protein
LFLPPRTADFRMLRHAGDAASAHRQLMIIWPNRQKTIAALFAERANRQLPQEEA